MKTLVVLYYLPAGRYPSDKQLALASAFLGTKVAVQDVEPDPPEPPTTWLVEPEYGFVYLSVESPATLTGSPTRISNDCVVSVEEIEDL